MVPTTTIENRTQDVARGSRQTGESEGPFPPVLIVDGNVAEVMKKARQRILLHIQVKGDLDPAAALLEQRDEVESVTIEKDMIIATLKPNIEDYSGLPSALITTGFALTLFREEEVNLETAFMQLTKGLVQ